MNSILFLGVAIVIVCATVQCALIAFLRRRARRWRDNRAAAHGFMNETLHLSVIVAALFLGMCAQVGIWALVYVLNGDLPDFQTAIYFSMSSFTTLGYGDVVLSGRNAILGPMEACNGILMAGLATGFLFSTFQAGFEKREADETARRHEHAHPPRRIR
ncbi:MAG: ion channel [Pikeienuella sp.]